MKLFKPLTEFQRVGWAAATVGFTISDGLLLWQFGAFARPAGDFPYGLLLFFWLVVVVALRLFIQDKDEGYLRRLYKLKGGA